MTTPDLSGAPLDDVKQWLAISGPRDDALLVQLLEAAWQTCLAFTGITAVASWAELDAALRHGVVRLAAHHYRTRDGAAPADPPSAVAALWRPWRSLRL